MTLELTSDHVKNIMMYVSLSFFIAIFVDPISGFACLFFPIVIYFATLQARRQNSHSENTSVRPRQTRPRNLGWRYNHLVNKIQMSGATGMSVEEATKQYASFFAAGEKSSRPFFENTQVQTVLGLTQQSMPQQSKQSSTDDGANNAFWANMAPTKQSSSSASESCAGPSCSNPISAFDFRCYQCRERFCESCKGSGLTCPSCS